MPHAASSHVSPAASSTSSRPLSVPVLPSAAPLTAMPASAPRAPEPSSISVPRLVLPLLLHLLVASALFLDHHFFAIALSSIRNFFFDRAVHASHVSSSSPFSSSSPASLPPPSFLRPLLRDTIISRMHVLANISDTPHTINRPYLSRASLRAQSLLAHWMTTANLTTHIDPAGNVIADLSCHSKPRPYVMLGSHHDTVPSAGRFDGVYGVLAAISITHLISDICAFPFDLRVVAFDDEEGNNPFGTTNLGARVYTGAFTAHTIPHRAQFLAAHRAMYPHLKQHPITALHRAKQSRPPRAYLELHLEQGPILERRGAVVGAVDAIAGQTRLRVTLRGVAGHAGTVPMSARRDALAAAAEGVLAAENVPRRVVATVGSIQVTPGASNVIPGTAIVSVDVRSASDRLRRRTVRAIVRAFQKAAARRSVQVAVDVTHDVDAVRMAPWLIRAVQDVVDGGVLTSGAGHDAQFLARVADTGMLFVRCRDGVSHRPDEFVADEDVFRGAWALWQALLKVRDHVEATDVVSNVAV